MPATKNSITFKPLAISDKPLFDNFFKEYPPTISEYTFTNLYCWNHHKHHEWRVIDGHLVISYVSTAKIRKFYVPIGENPEKVIEKILHLFPQSSVEKVEAHLAKQLREKYAVKKQQEMFDYVYLLSDLQELKGEKYRAKRNFVSRGAAYNPSLKIMDETDIIACRALEEKWGNLRRPSDNSQGSAENIALQTALSNYKLFGLFGLVAYVGKKIVGFAIGEPLNPTTFVEHFEKANTDYTGMYPFVLHEFCKRIPRQFIFLNREQDLGISGLRKSKLSYHPSMLIEKYVITETY